MLWPTKYAPMTTSLNLGGKDGARVLLPIVPPGKRPAPNFLPPAEAPPELPGFESLDTRHDVRLRRDLIGRSQSADGRSEGDCATNTGASRNSLGHGDVSRDDRAPHLGCASREHRQSSARIGWRRRWKAACCCGKRSFRSRSDFDNFYYDTRRRLSENGKKVREKTWKRRFPATSSNPSSGASHVQFPARRLLRRASAS